jgi:hypothetical protein
VSPILVRPVREQLEHDRMIRQLQAKFRRKYDAMINPGAEQQAPVKSGTTVTYPDILLFSQERGRRLQAVIEVETGESVNHLEALAQWAHFARLRVAFFLYVPAGMVDVARRLCEDNQIHVNEIWSYHTVGDQVRFTLVHRSREAPGPVSRPPRRAAAASVVRKKPAPRSSRPAGRSARSLKEARTRKRLPRERLQKRRPQKRR